MPIDADIEHLRDLARRWNTTEFGIGEQWRAATTPTHILPLLDTVAELRRERDAFKHEIAQIKARWGEVHRLCGDMNAPNAPAIDRVRSVIENARDEAYERAAQWIEQAPTPPGAFGLRKAWAEGLRALTKQQDAPKTG